MEQKFVRFPALFCDRIKREDETREKTREPGTDSNSMQRKNKQKMTCNFERFMAGISIYITYIHFVC